MNERIGTFCEKCREVVCRCAEYKNTEELVKEAFKVQPIYEINPEFAEVFKEPYGWCIENNHKGFGFDKHFNHKVYNSKEIALEAVKQMKKTGIYNRIDTWRIFPVYQGKIEEL